MARSMLTRRSFLQVSGGAIGLAALAACAAPAAAPAGSSGEAAAPAEQPGTLWVLHKQDFHPGYNDFIRAHIVKFAEDNNLKLDVAYTSGFAGTGTDVQKVAAAVQAGDAPDVWIDNQNPFRLAALDLLQDVTDLQQEVIDMYGGDPAPRAKKETFLDGKYAGVTLHTRSDGGWARKDIFEPAGIDLASIKTYDVLAEACLEVSDPANEMWGWGMTVSRNGDGAWLIDRVVQGWGAPWVDETGQYVTMNTPECVAAVEFLVDLYTNPKWEPMLPPGVLSWTDTGNNEAYLGEKVAYTQNAGTVYAKAVADGLPVAEKTIYDVPKGGPVNENFMGLGGMYLQHIMEDANPEMARQLIMSFFNDETMNGIYSNAVAYALPGYEVMWDWDVIQASPISLQMKAAALDPSGWNALAWPGPSTAQIGAVGSSNIDTDMVANVLNGSMTAQESVEDAYKKSVQIFKDFGAPGEK